MVKDSIKQVAVLGAGVMGAQIAAHFVNAKIPVILYDLPAKEGPANAIVEKALMALSQLKPAPLALPDLAAFIQPAHYQDDLPRLSACDLVIEVVAERLDIKQSLYQQIAPHLHEKAVLASNTSGLSITSLRDCLPANLHPRFLGMHFFNPPRYMPLVELIPSDTTDDAVLDRMETLLTMALGKTVVRAKDTPNFIANRIGVFSLLVTAQHAAHFGLPFELVDALTGELIGRPKSATFRTLDVVGLDTMAHVIKTMAGTQTDPWLSLFVAPTWLTQLIEAGRLGQKSGGGIYQKTGQTISVFDPATQTYRPANAVVDPAIQTLIAEQGIAAALLSFRTHASPQAQFLWACFRDVFHYCSYWLADIAESTRDVDQALRSGFGWKQGPFELWQLGGLSAVRDAMVTDLQSDKAAAIKPLPAWLFDIDAFYIAGNAFHPRLGRHAGASTLPVYARQLTRDYLLTEMPPEGRILFETPSVRLWTLDDEIGILSFMTKHNVIGSGVIQGIIEAMPIAEQWCRGVVLWQFDAENFSLGANLKEFAPQFAGSSVETIAEVVRQFQVAALALRYASIPVVAGIRGRVLGGGVEFVLHCDAAVLSMESYLGLVEVGVGLIPAGGGCKEMAIRAMRGGRDSHFADIQRYFQQIAMAQVGMSAYESAQFGYLPPDHDIILHPHEVLFVAIQKAKALADAAYRPPLSPQIVVQGRQGMAALKAILLNMQMGGFITEHEYQLGLGLADVICGGDLNANAVVDEAWFLKIERETFARFAKTEKTQARIKQMLETGKPLRN